MRQAYPNAYPKEEPDENVEIFIKYFCEEYTGLIKPFLPEAALTVQKFFDVGRDACHVKAFLDEKKFTDRERSIISHMLWDLKSGRRYYHTGSPVTLPPELFFTEEFRWMAELEQKNKLPVNGLVFDEKIAGEAGYQADGRELGTGGWIWQNILAVQGITSKSMYDAMLSYGKTTIASAAVGGLGFNATGDDDKVESAEDGKSLSANDIHDHQVDNSPGGGDVEMMDTRAGPSNAHQASTVPDATEDDDQEMADAPPIINNAPKTTRKRQSRAKAATLAESEEPPKKVPRKLRKIPEPNIVNVTDEMKETATSNIARLIENFKPNTKEPHIKPVLNLFNRPNGQGPTEQPISEEKPDPFHFRKLRGNPPPGVVYEHWDKAFNSAHSVFYNLYKHPLVSQITDDKLRKLAWEESKKNGSMRDVALCILVQKDQLLLPFTDLDP